jgi:hypothetical protein
MRRLIVLAVVLGLAVLAGGLIQRRLSGHSKPVDVAAFLAAHWQRPLKPQGQVPADFSALEGSLAAASCSSCHQPQWQDWRTSLHAGTVSAGLLWQFHLMAPAAANECLDCHAPLAEQKALIAREFGWPNAPRREPPAYVPPGLAHEGLSCAACHVRRHERFGPSARDTVASPSAHHGFTANPAFEDSRFCSSCHQFPDDGPRVAGKLREDTYAQWQASRFAAEGVACQSCHMPDRRHLWQGIHAPEMVRKALAVALEANAGQLSATLTNVGAGHYFPTYLVPEVRAQLWLMDKGEERLLGDAVIAWKVNIDLDKEEFDTRLPPGGTLKLEVPFPRAASADAAVELRLEVAPGEHYERSFASVLVQRNKLDATTLKLLEQALAETRAGRYSLTLGRYPIAACVAGPQQRQKSLMISGLGCES